MRNYNIFYNQDTAEIRAVYEELPAPEGFEEAGSISHDPSNWSSQILHNKAIRRVTSKFEGHVAGYESVVKIYDVEPYGTEKLPDTDTREEVARVAEVQPEAVPVGGLAADDIKDDVAEPEKTPEPEPEPEAEPEKELPTEVVLTSNVETALKVGQSFKIESSTEADLAYESSDKAIVTVTKAGTVKAVAPGEAVVRTALKDNLDVYADTTVKVEAEEVAE